jgi:hypothetical protein
LLNLGMLVCELLDTGHHEAVVVPVKREHAVEVNEHRIPSPGNSRSRRWNWETGTQRMNQSFDVGHD